MQSLLLGALEKAVLHALWEQRELDAKQLHEHLSPDHAITLSTVQSTLERLCKKGIITRVKISHAFRYRPLLERGVLISQWMTDVFNQLRYDKNVPVLSHFLDVAEHLNESALDELERLIKLRKEQREDEI